jgi:hypothetical protein
MNEPRITPKATDIEDRKNVFVIFFGFLGQLPFALVVGIAADYVAYRGALFLLHVPRGAFIRPMFEAFVPGMAALVAFVFGIPLAIGEINRNRKNGRWIGVTAGVIGLILCLSVLQVSNGFWDYFARQRNISFEE